MFSATVYNTIHKARKYSYCVKNHYQCLWYIVSERDCSASQSIQARHRRSGGWKEGENNIQLHYIVLYQAELSEGTAAKAKAGATFPHTLDTLIQTI